jgi:lipooligosaccharide transport system permease protein
MGIISYFKRPKITKLSLKDWQRNRDVFTQTYRVNFIPPVLEPLLYLFALGFGLGSLVGTVKIFNLTIKYTRFIAPALVSISIMNSAFFECTYGSFVRMHYQKTFDAMIATPLSLEDVIAGELMWGATRSLINGTIILLVVSAFGLVNFSFALLILPVAFLGGFLFASLGMIFTAISPNIDTLNYPTFLLITPMLLFSGTFFPLSVLPKALQMLALAALPLANVVSLNQGLTLKSLGWLQLYNLAWILIVSIVLAIVSINLMKKRLIE